ncbi:hypothetical protein AB9F29_05755 [Falsihalocynthiibacter sp. S25ZX9]|uniref:hypothetical protein n=1 Tax=Falsihalocynthiibacter sp. S25ZX9 TaxID=3240870 RepID=UPI003510C8F4
MNSVIDLDSVQAEQEYSAPKLHVYGGLVELTASGSSGGNENTFGTGWCFGAGANSGYCKSRKP